MSTVLSLSEHLVIKGADKMEKDERMADKELEIMRQRVAEEHKD